MKKILALLLATALFLVACGSKNESSSSDGNKGGTSGKT